MNLFEAKQIAESHGFTVSKSKKGGNDKVPPWAKLDEGKKGGNDKVPPWAKLDEGKKGGDKVPPWAKLDEGKKGDDKVPPWAKLDEAKTIAEEAGYKVIKKGGFGTAEGTLFTSICEKYINKAYFVTLAARIGLKAAIAEFLEEVRKCIGKGVSAEYYNKFAIRMKACNSETDALFTISNAMLAGQGMALH